MSSFLLGGVLRRTIKFYYVLYWNFPQHVH